MYTRRIYKLLEVALWTRFETYFFIGFITAWVSLYFFFGLSWFRIPWTVLALIGTAVSFVIGFQNNSVYGRIWEARKIWGGIVNTSRTFGVLAQDLISDEHSKDEVSPEEIRSEVRALTYRHIAWMTALRYSMRTNKVWETTNNTRTNREWGLVPPESKMPLDEALSPYLSSSEMDYLRSKDNKQTALLYLQSHHLKQLKHRGLLWEFSFLEMQNQIEEMFTLQGQSERIKNFPFPRQYATINHYFMWLLLLLLPLALVPQFVDIGIDITEKHSEFGRYFVWFSIPFYTAIAWMFHTMERIGRTGENPFEGTSNDVPISTISRAIEIDLRQNLGEDKQEIPLQFEEEHHIQW